VRQSHRRPEKGVLRRGGRGPGHLRQPVQGRGARDHDRQGHRARPLGRLGQRRRGLDGAAVPGGGGRPAWLGEGQGRGGEVEAVCG